MAFKLKPPFNINSSPVYERELEEGCLGKGNKNGTILVNPDQTAEAKESVEDHKNVSRHAVVKSVPLAYSTNIKVLFYFLYIFVAFSVVRPPK